MEYIQQDSISCHPELAIALLGCILKWHLFHYFLEGGNIRLCCVAISNGHVKICMIPPQPWHLNRLVQDGQGDWYKEPWSWQVHLETKQCVCSHIT
jgi:hypothetical protein